VDLLHSSNFGDSSRALSCGGGSRGGMDSLGQFNGVFQHVFNMVVVFPLDRGPSSFMALIGSPSFNDQFVLVKLVNCRPAASTASTTAVDSPLIITEHKNNLRELQKYMKYYRIALNNYINTRIYIMYEPTNQTIINNHIFF
jgi:hypothetical protein